MKYQRLLVTVVMVWWLILTTLVHAAPSPQCFAETGLCIASEFQAFWQQNGGNPVFGQPISERTQRVVDGQQIISQQFERARIERNASIPAPYTIQLALIGADVFAQTTGARMAPASQRDAIDAYGQHMATRRDCAWFDTTQQYVCGEFYTHWRTHGVQLDDNKAISYAESLALFGLPISAPYQQTISGTAYTVQYFERARLEYHPANPAAYRIQAGLLGREVLDRAVASTLSGANAPQQPTPTLVLLPQSDLDTFRNNMPPFGYWNSPTSDPVVLAVSELHYASVIPTINGLVTYRNTPPKGMKYVVGLYDVINNRPTGGDGVTVDFDYVTLIDFEGTEHTAELLTRKLSNPMKWRTVPAGQRYGGEIVFVIPNESAVAQIKATFPNTPPITIELRVWPHIP